MGFKWAADAKVAGSMAAVALLAAGLAACTVNTAPAASPAGTATASAPASHAPAANSSATPASRASDTSAGQAATGKLPDYRPSTIVSESGTTTVLRSPDSVTKVGAFYQSALANGGWDTTSSSMGSFHASFTAHRAGEGVSVSVYPRFGGSGISVSRYPV
jgi:hypothetical protein